ncbi:uncharacterized protein LOC110454126 [Mizuhopecten yessoensis]|uniref:uncharacterized protein LOC110454126 n=1 Tax=Mizuhopecten yessoensis TaxID=6573 RepID=UPI000B45E78E|nr:uncharacterized protein LOC110454126 [Mizuhopecten yessoensis]
MQRDQQEPFLRPTCWNHSYVLPSGTILTSYLLVPFLRPTCSDNKHTRKLTRGPHPDSPTASSSPIKQNNKTATSYNKFIKPIRIATINFQSISNKKPYLDQIIHSLKPDIIIETETWLNNTISSYEYFPVTEYTVYRKDHNPNKNGQSHGGVLLAITNKYNTEQIKELETDNESIFNLPHIDWQNNTTIPGKQEQKLHQHLLDIIDNNSLTQITTKSTRGNHILDLALTNRPSIINKTETTPPLGKSDHDTVYTEIDVRLKRTRREPRNIYLYNKANWNNIRNDLTLLNTKLNKQPNQTADNLWDMFKTTLTNSVTKNIPQKHITYKSKLPWITHSLLRLMRKCKQLHTKTKTRHELIQKYKSAKSELQTQTRNAYLSYKEKAIKDLPIDEPSTPSPSKKFNSKKLFPYIKTTRKENTDITTLRKDGQLKTDTTCKANILNEQFESAFGTEQDCPIPDKGPSPHPLMPEIHITEQGIYRLLNNINPHKATYLKNSVTS